MSSAQMQNLRIGALEEAQWQLASMQLVNFGPFDGYHAFNYKTGFDHAPTTVVAGDSGTGKSTLEDAFFEVMTRNGSYNTASNEGGRVGSLTSEKRSLIGYVRGKLADTEDEDGNQVARLLRDGSCNRWSAVVLTFESDAHTVFTVAKLFWIGAGYNANADIKQLRITMYAPFDPRVLEPIAAQNFTADRLRRLIGSDFKSFSRVDEFLTYIYQVLKVDESGQGKDVFDLLGRIRSGAGFRSIAELFREQVLDVPVSLKTLDNVSTDDITPASAEFSSMRSNIPLMSQYCYHRYAPDFAARAKELGKSIIIGGENYGQGSSREHAAINPMYLGVKCVIAKSIARIHKGNLVNHGIIPMLFEDPAAYDSIDQGDELRIENLLDQIPTRRVTVKDVTKHFAFTVKLDLTDNEIEVVLAGGQLRYLRKQLETCDLK